MGEVMSYLGDKEPEVNEVALVMMAAWTQAEGKPVNVSYVATFADMAQAVVEYYEEKNVKQ